MIYIANKWNGFYLIRQLVNEVSNNVKIAFKVDKITCQINLSKFVHKLF